MARRKVKTISADARDPGTRGEDDRKPPETIHPDERERQKDRLLRLGDEVFFKHARGLHEADPAEQQRAQKIIDAFHHAGDMVFCTYQNHPEKWQKVIDECRQRIDELIGERQG
jgi:hypothetical protein